MTVYLGKWSPREQESWKSQTEKEVVSIKGLRRNRIYLSLIYQSIKRFILRNWLIQFGGWQVWKSEDRPTAWKLRWEVMLPSWGRTSSSLGNLGFRSQGLSTGWRRLTHNFLCILSPEMSWSLSQIPISLGYTGYHPSFAIHDINYFCFALSVKCHHLAFAVQRSYYPHW